MTIDQDTPGLAGGPGQMPPGYEGNTPSPREPAPDESGAADKQREAGEASERSAGTRGGEIREDGGQEPGTPQPEEQQPEEG